MKRRAVFALTLLLAAPALACGGRQPAPPPASTPDPVAPPPPPTPGVTDRDGMTVAVCVVKDGRIGTVDVRYNTATGDTIVDGRPFREVYPVTEEYAASKAWYANHEPITYNGRRYVQYGLPRVFGSADVVAAGTSGGVRVFVERDANPGLPEVVYLPVDPRCEFQPYHGPETGGAVRG